jgi:hypothetical protein
MTNQLYDLVEHKAFKDLYCSIGIICPFASSIALAKNERLQFNDSRKALRAEIEETCQSFSISFDG